MPHSLPLITTLATALGIALLMGALALRLKLPTLVGYLLAGVMIGPFTPGFVADIQIATELAEVGVMLLMFGVGLHFSVEQLLEIRKIAVPGAVIQIVAATLLSAWIAVHWGWPVSSALVFGLALSVASTVVLIRALESQGLLNSINGQIAVGWLIVEDIAMVLVLVFLPFIALWFGDDKTVVQTHGHLAWVLTVTIIKLVSFVCLMLFVGRWMLPKLLSSIIRTGSRELFTLCVMSVAVGVAFASAKLFDVSFALGAFFAGMIIRESKYSEQAAEESLPFRDAFAVLFFVSVGMLFDPKIFIQQPLQVLAVVGIIVIGKSIVAALLVLAFRYPFNTALTVSASLAQIGEFSFILAAHGVYLKILPPEGQALIVAGALISISINPFLFKIISPLQNWIRLNYPAAMKFERSDDPLGELPQDTEQKYLANHVVLVGFGEIGKRIGAELTTQHIPFVTVEQNRDLVSEMRHKGFAAVVGNASEPATLIQAHVTKARMIVITISELFDIRQMVRIALNLNPEIAITIQVKNKFEKTMLSKEIPGVFFWSEEELANSMSEHIVKKFKTERAY